MIRARRRKKNVSKLFLTSKVPVIALLRSTRTSRVIVEAVDQSINVSEGFDNVISSLGDSKGGTIKSNLSGWATWQSHADASGFQVAEPQRVQVLDFLMAVCLPSLRDIK